MGSRTQPNDARSDEPTARPPRPLPDASLTRSRPRTAADGVLRRAAKTVRITADIQDRAHRSGWRVRYFEYRPGPSHAAHPGNPGFLTVANAVEVVRSDISPALLVHTGPNLVGVAVQGL